jgi:hypothetical protein
MARRDASGITVTLADVPIIIGMIARGDRHHDIAAWFGLNQGRIAETRDGEFGPPQTTPNQKLPPKGPPGPKGRELREAVNDSLARSSAGDHAGALPNFRRRLSAMTPTKRSRPFVPAVAGREAPTSGVVPCAPPFPKRTTHSWWRSSLWRPSAL